MADHPTCECSRRGWCNCTKKNLNYSEIKFTVDLFNYVLREYNVHWKLPEPPVDLQLKRLDFPTKKLFTKNMGDMVMFQLLYYRNAYKRLRGAMFPNGNWSVGPLEELVAALFSEGARPFFPQLLVFFAYTCHMCLYCAIEENYCLVLQLMAVTSSVIAVDLKDHLKENGGWKAFERFVNRAVRSSAIAKAA